MKSFKTYFLTRPSSEIDSSYLSRLFILVKLTGASKVVADGEFHHNPNLT